MAISKNKFRKGVILKPDTEALEGIEGELKVDSADGKIKATLGGSAREVLTNSQSSTLTNKSIDADNNTISNLEVDNLKSGVLDTDLSSVSALDDTLPSAKAVKAYVDLKVGEKDQASEISYDPTSSGLTATNVQAAIDEIDIDVDDLNTLSGVAKNAVNLGTFTGVTIPDNQNNKQALQALETAHEAHLNDAVDAHDASAISNVPAGTISSTDVQAAINELDGDIQGHINDTVDAHDASAISVVPSGNLASTDVQSALVELQGDINGKVSGPGSSTDNAVARFDGTSGAVIQNSLVTIDDTGIASGFTQINVDNLRLDGNVVSAQTGNLDLSAASLSQVNVFSDVYLSAKVGVEQSLDNTSGSSVTLATPTTKLIRLTNSGLTSISEIPAPINSQEIILENATGANITLNDNTGATAANRILTGTKATITLKDEASIPLIYDTVEQRWMVAAGTGSGGSQALDTIFQLSGEELLLTWSSGNNAAFLGGGTLAGTFVYDTSTPLNGTSSYLYTQAAGSLNDYIASPIQSVPVRFRGNISTATFTYLYNGNSTDIEPIVYCTTTLQKLTLSSNLLPSTGTNASIYKVNVTTIPSTCVGIRVGFQVKVLNSGKVLEFDDIEMSADTTKYADPSTVTDWQSYTPTFTGFGTVTTSNIKWRRVGSSIEIAGTFLSGTVSATEARLSIPNSFRSLANLPTVSAAGQWYKSEVSANNGGPILIEPNISYVTFSGRQVYGPDSVAPLVKGTGVDVSSSGQTVSVYASFPVAGLSASNPQIVTPSESFSSDTASLVYASSAAFTLTTLADAPVGTFITFTYAANTNTRTQTTSAPTQTTTDMNVNGILLYTRAHNGASTAAQPAAIAIQIGKGHKGKSLELFKATGKVNNGSFDVFFDSTRKIGAAFKEYNEATGIVYLDAAYDRTASSTTSEFNFTDATVQTSGYVVINASKSPALVGVPQVLPRIATLSDVKASGTNGGASSAATFHTRTLNTLVDSTGIVTSLSANQFVLQAGTYYIEASAPSQKADRHKLRLRNITAGTNALVGTSENVDGGTVAASTRSFVVGEVIITAPTTFELQHYTQSASATVGLGNATANGDSEVYTVCRIQKIK